METSNNSYSLSNFEESLLRTIYEVEVKIPIENEEDIVEAILHNRGQWLNSETQSDMYFDHPCRSFSKTDESVRVRSCLPSNTELAKTSDQFPIELTYKGPKVDKTTKTRLEYTSKVDCIDSIVAILQHTGFKLVATITKKRMFYRINEITIGIDNVDQVGQYIEFELMAKGEDEMDKARKRITELIQLLGLDATKTVRESYLELYLKRMQS